MYETSETDRCNVRLRLGEKLQPVGHTPSFVMGAVPETAELANEEMRAFSFWTSSLAVSLPTFFVIGTETKVLRSATGLAREKEARDAAMAS